MDGPHEFCRRMNDKLAIRFFPRSHMAWLLAAFAVMGLGLPALAQPGPADTWFTYQHDSRRSGQTDAVLADELDCLWRLMKGEGGGEVSPVIGPDGTVYVAAAQNFAAVTPEGALRWYVTALNGVFAPPVIRADGDFFMRLDGFGKFDHTDASRICTAPLGDHAVMDAAGNVYAVSDGFDAFRWSVRKADPACGEVWRYGGEGQVVPTAPAAIAPDGGIVVTLPDGLLKLNPDTGEELWRVPFEEFEGPVGDAVIGLDDVIYNTIGGLTCPGEQICNVEIGMCPDGVNECRPSALVATDADGSLRWKLDFADTLFEVSSVSPAVGGDGVIYVPGQVGLSAPQDAVLVAVSPDGSEAWSFTEPEGIVGLSPAVDGGGTIVFPTWVGQIVSLTADGEERSRIDAVLDKALDTVYGSGEGGGAPVKEGDPPLYNRVELDFEGTIQDVNIRLALPHGRVGDLRISLIHRGVEVVLIDQVCGDFIDFACLTLDDEAELNFNEHCQDGFCDAYQPVSPLATFDGARVEDEWALKIEDLEDGHVGTFQNWELEVLVRRDEQLDYLATPPAIGEDGTLYVVTYHGSLLAYGDGCPGEIEIVPDFVYRRVAMEGDLFGEYIIQEIESFDLAADGRVTFRARTQGPSEFTVFVEQNDGSFKPYGRRSVVDGVRLDDAFTARFDDDGDLYMTANVAEHGAGVFINDELTLSIPARPIELAPVIPHDFEAGFFDISPGKNFLLKGRPLENDPLSILRVRTESEQLETVLARGLRVDEVNGFDIDTDVRHRRQINSGGEFVAAGEKGLVVNGRLTVRAGERVGRYSVYNLSSPQLTDAGAYYFQAETGQQNGVFDAADRRVGTADVVDGFEIALINRFEVSADQHLAFAAVLTQGRKGVFLDDKAVAVSGVTEIEGQLVQEIFTDTLTHTNAGQVAFVARVNNLKGVYVAAANPEPGPPFTFRRALQQGDLIRGDHPVADIFRIELAETGLMAARGQVDQGVEAQILETAEGVFDALFRMEQIGGLTFTNGPVAPRVDDDGHVFHLLETAEVGPTLFRDGQPLVQLNVEGATAPIRLDTWNADFKLFDVSYGDHVLLYGRAQPGGADWLLRINAVNQTVEEVFDNGHDFPGWTIEDIHTSPLDERHVHANTRTFVVSGEERQGVLVDNQIAARDGMTIDGRTLTAFRDAQVDGPAPVFIAEFEGGNGVFDPQRAHAATGDVIGGHTLDTVLAHSHSNGVSAFSATLRDGGAGVFRGGAVVAVEGVTRIDGSLVMRIDPAPVRKDALNDVAFVAELENGRTSAFVASGPDGELQYRRAATVGEPLGGVTLDFNVGRVHTPREDADGITYQSFGASTGLQTVFQDDRPLIQSQDPRAVAPLRVFDFDSRFFDAADHEHLVLLGHLNDGDSFGVIHVHAAAGRITAPILVGAPMRPARVASVKFAATDQRHVNEDGDLTFAVLSTRNGVEAVLNASGTLKSTGDVMAGYTLVTFDQPQVNSAGNYAFLATTTHPEFGAGSGVFLMAEDRLIGSGDIIGDYTVLSVETYAFQDDNTMAFIGMAAPAEGPEARGVFTGGGAVAVAGVDEIGGELVVAVDPFAVRYDRAGRVAFVAETDASPAALYVAAPDPNEGFVFRRVAALGDVIEGSVVESFADFRLTDEGLTRFVSLGDAPAQFIETRHGGFEVILSGHVLGARTVESIDDLRLDDAGLVGFRSGDAPLTQTLFRELAPGLFRTYIDGDRLTGLRLDFTLATPFAPRVDADGNEFLFAAVAPVGPVIFVNRVPIAHASYSPPSEAPMTIERFDSGKYIDFDQNGRFLVKGGVRQGDPPSLVEVDTVEQQISTLLSVGDDIEDVRVDRIDLAPRRAYGDDGVPVMWINDNVLPVAATPDRIIVRTGDEVDGVIIDDLMPPRRTPDGDVYYRASGKLFRHPLDGPGRRVIDPYDVVAGQPLLGVESFEVTSGHHVAYTAPLAGRRTGVFLDDEPVAIAGATRIDLRRVMEVRGGPGGDPSDVDVNDYGQVAFVAREQGRQEALYLASPLRPMDGNGDCRIDLIDLDAFVGCISGPGQEIRPECQIFDINNDCRCGMDDFQLFQERYTGFEESIENCRSPD